jgi:methionine synthase I (cobalamin-dependent)
VLVFASLSPLEDCYRPDLVPDDETLAREHEWQARAIAAAGADGILLETHNTARELAAAAVAARRTGLPFVASMITDGAGRLLSGEPIESAVRAVASTASDALSINCVPARRLAGDLEVLGRAAPGTPLAAYGNLGPPTGPGATRFTAEIEPAEYASLAREWIGLGARMVGGCCGTTAAHTRALRSMLDAPKP